MKKMIAVMAFGALVLASVATAMSSRVGADGIDQAQVNAKIDSRLHDLLIAARVSHAR